MNTSKHTFLTLSLCLFVVWQGLGQQAVIESASGALTPQLQLTETVNNEFTRLIFKNQGDLSKRWTLATRSGTGITDFGLYYNGGARMLYNEANKLLRLSGVQQEIAFDSSSGDPNLLLTQTSGGSVCCVPCVSFPIPQPNDCDDDDLTITSDIISNRIEYYDDFVRTSGTVNQASPINSSFHAGNFLELNPGFEVMQGAELLLTIEGCL